MAWFGSARTLAPLLLLLVATHAAHAGGFLADLKLYMQSDDNLNHNLRLRKDLAEQNFKVSDLTEKLNGLHDAPDVKIDYVDSSRSKMTQDLLDAQNSIVKINQELQPTEIASRVLTSDEFAELFNFIMADCTAKVEEGAVVISQNSGLLGRAFAQDLRRPVETYMIHNVFSPTTSIDLDIRARADVQPDVDTSIAHFYLEQKAVTSHPKKWKTNGESVSINGSALAYAAAANEDISFSCTLKKTLNFLAR